MTAELHIISHFLTSNGEISPFNENASDMEMKNWSKAG